MEVRGRRHQQGSSCFCVESDDEAEGRRLRETTARLARGCLTNLTVCLLLVGYTFLGAVVFLAVEGGGREGPLAESVRANASWPGEEARQRAVENIWEITVSLNILYKENWTRLAGEELARFQAALVHRISEEMAVADQLRTRRAPRPPEWTLPKSFLYSLTLLTTIGYGGMAPRTGLGKAVTMGYAAVGIPLVLLYLSSVGSLLSACARNVFTRSLCCCLCSNCGYCCYDEKRMQEKEKRMRRKRERREMEELRRREPFYLGTGVQEVEDPSQDSLSEGSYEPRSAATFLAPLLLCLVVMVVYIGGGAALLCRLDSAWSYLDGVFFCFLLLSTIGSGDSVPTDSALSASYRRRSPLGELTIWFCSAYILCGLALTAMCFHVVYDEVIHRLRHNYEDVKNQKSELKLSNKFIEDPPANDYMTPS